MSSEFVFPKGYNEKFLDGASATWKEVSYYSSITDCKRRANIILPKDYSLGRKYPVLFLLHGIGGDEEEWKEAGPEYISANLALEKKAKEMVIVLVNVRTRKNDSRLAPDFFSLAHFAAFDAFREDLLLNLLPYMEKNFSIRTDREGVAIAGLSMGGRESLYIGLTRPERFCTIGAFCPAFGLLPYANNGVEEKGLLTDTGFALPEEWKNTLIIETAGKSDIIVRDEPYRYHMAMESDHTAHEYYELEGGHDFGVWSQSLYYFLQKVF